MSPKQEVPLVYCTTVSRFSKCKNYGKMSLFEGDNCHAVMIKNYEDKRDITPWRAVRVLTYFDETDRVKSN